jgi:hypothetical protein
MLRRWGRRFPGSPGNGFRGHEQGRGIRFRKRRKDFPLRGQSPGIGFRQFRLRFRQTVRQETGFFFRQSGNAGGVRRVHGGKAGGIGRFSKSVPFPGRHAGAFNRFRPPFLSHRRRRTFTGRNQQGKE